MFSGLRQNSLFYILDKSNTPTLQIGQVVSVSNEQPKYPTGYAPGSYNPHPMETTVDVKVKVNDSEMTFQNLPSNMQIANDKQMVVSDSREAMTAEVDAMLRNSKQIVESVDYHQQVIQSCEEMLTRINPQIAKEKQQEQDICNLKSDVSGMKGDISDMKGMLSDMLERISKK